MMRALDDEKRARVIVAMIRELDPIHPFIVTFYKQHVNAAPDVGWYIMWCHICDVAAGWGRKESAERRETFRKFLDDACAVMRAIGGARKT